MASFRICIEFKVPILLKFTFSSSIIWLTSSFVTALTSSLSGFSWLEACGILSLELFLQILKMLFPSFWVTASSFFSDEIDSVAPDCFCAVLLDYIFSFQSLINLFLSTIGFSLLRFLSSTSNRCFIRINYEILQLYFLWIELHKFQSLLSKLLQQTYECYRLFYDSNVFFP